MATDTTPAISIEALQGEIASLRAHLERTQVEFQRHYRGALEDFLFASVRAPLPPPDGIVHCLRRRPDAAPSALSVRSSADGGPSLFAAANAAVPRTDCVFCSGDRPGQWLCYTFTDGPRFVSAYVLQSCPFAPGSVHPRSWALEGSGGGGEWTELDSRRDSDALNGPSVLAHFTAERPGRFASFRLRQTGPNHAGNDVFAIGYFDLCGRKADSRTRATFAAPDPPDLKGIIAHLTQEFGGNVARRGTVKVTGIPLDNASNHAIENVVDLEDAASHFWSKDSPNQWFSYDFGERRIVCAAYVIRSTSGGDAGFNHLRSWVIEVANAPDGPWDVIDHRADNSELNSRSAIVRFDIENPQESRLIRLRQTNVNHYHSPSGCTNSIVLSGLEIFGDLIMSE
jgi:hypothetical protein